MYAARKTVTLNVTNRIERCCTLYNFHPGKRECKSRAGKWQSCVGRAAQIARLVGIHGKYKVLHSKYKQQSTKYKAQNEKQIRSKVTAMICTSYKVQNTT